MAEFSEKDELTISHLKLLNLRGMASEFENQLRSPGLYDNTDFSSRIMLMCRSQEDLNNKLKKERLLRRAHFKRVVMLEDLPCGRQYGFTENKRAELSALRWCRSQFANIIISGRSGVGKTSLAQALGMKAISEGIPAVFYNANDMLESLVNMNHDARERFRNNLNKIPVLILDDLGLSNYNQEATLRFYNIINDRYKFGSVIITTQLNKTGIKKCFSGDTEIDAIIRRLYEDVYEIKLDAPRPKALKYDDENTSEDNKDSTNQEII